MSAYVTLKSYRGRVESYVREYRDHPVIRKLSTNKPITETELNALEDIFFNSDLVGTKQEYVDTYGDKPLGVFIRENVVAAQAAFADFIQTGSLSADQMTFINTIIRYLTKNGMIDKKMLFEAPFTNLRQDGVVGLFDEWQCGGSNGAVEAA